MYKLLNLTLCFILVIGCEKSDEDTTRNSSRSTIALSRDESSVRFITDDDNIVLSKILGKGSLSSTKENTRALRDILDLNIDSLMNREEGILVFGDLLGMGILTHSHTLVMKKAMINQVNEHGFTTLQMAAQKGYSGIVKDLLEAGADPDLRGKRNTIALSFALGNKHSICAELILNYDANPNLCDDEGFSPLHYATRSELTQSIKILIEMGADMNQMNIDGLTPLMMAAWNDKRSSVKMLIACSVDVNFRDRVNATALLHAADEGNLEVCEMLLDAEAEVEIMSNSGHTPLIAAAVIDHPKLVKLLLTHGASISTCGIKDYTVLDAAKAAKSHQVIPILENASL